ncbi:cytochrome c family protein [Sinorhizobium numidicum]|uniref:Cytochrome c family protein n=1 Tax=Sinorhizobium numidicum TaxID=680248 RepID=A0ABY8CZ70_9HYPH|nr:cytochrome c family protein [Sinorhizobium numidicum]WEX76761.1 cytochrome c family protein [Sinorhizobium numidicum]WEX83422.1 cytochrome c family protein [Sinorhizobium numidicum]
MNKLVIAALASLITAVVATPVLSQGADTAPGQRLFQQRCGACHQIATPRNGVGPNLQGVVGRTAGNVEGFKYSAALRDSGVTWTPEKLETFLSNPTAMVRGTRMAQRFNNAEERRAIIEFLGSQ